MNNDDGELEHELHRVLIGRSDGPRQADVDHIRRLATQRPANTKSPRSTRLAGVPTWLAGAVAASLILLAFVGGIQVGDRGKASSSGVTEFVENLDLADGGRIAVEGRRTAIGRVITVGTADLPILPTGEYYEVWFVAADDTATAPDRISAGTFHPDSNGITNVSLTAAVDPAKYPTLVITAEPPDGNPAPSATEITRGDLTLVPG